MPKDYAALPVNQVRRSDRAVEDEWIVEMLRNAPFAALATVHDEQPFINTNLFVYDEAAHAIYMHTGRYGRTRSNVEANERVCFSVSEIGRLLPADEALEFSVEYAGITVFGRSSVIDGAEAEHALQMLLDKYAPHLKPGRDLPPHHAGRTQAHLGLPHRHRLVEWQAQASRAGFPRRVLLRSAPRLTNGAFMSSPRTEFLAGVKATIPLELGGLPFGIIFGALAVTAGISVAGTMAMSLFVFAGSAQFIAVGLVGAGAGVPVIILTTFVVNLRHALYSATLAPFVKHLPQHWLLPLGFMLTDESFVVASTHYNEPGDLKYKHWYFLGANLSMYVSWQVFTWIGIFAGTRIPDPARLGLDFAMIVTFTGMLIPLIKNRPILAAVTVASIVAVLTFPMPNNIGLLVAALSGVAAGVITESFSDEPPEPIPSPTSPEEAA